MKTVITVLFTFLIVFFSSLCFYLYNRKVLQPQKIRSKLKQQGINGPKPSILSGNLSEMRKLVLKEKLWKPTQHSLDIILPYLEKWRKTYGPIFSYSIGSKTFLYVSNSELVKEIKESTSLDLGKSTYMKKTLEPLFGHGIVNSNGKAWHFQRNLFSHDFLYNKPISFKNSEGNVWIHSNRLIMENSYHDEIEAMMKLMDNSAKSVIESWRRKIQHEGGMAVINVTNDLHKFSADVISEVCFGHSNFETKEIFSKLRDLQIALTEPNLLVEISGLRYLPTKRNRQVWRLNKEVRMLILKLIDEKARQDCAINKGILHDVFQRVRGKKNAHDLVVDNCKLIHLTARETIATTAAWCLLLLSYHPEWQCRVRNEILEVCRGLPPNLKQLGEMKALEMVIKETLRLYPPSAFIARETLDDMSLGGKDIPKGVYIYIPIKTLHHDADTWGLDADEFNPERFSRWLTNAEVFRWMYAPFGLGMRSCLGKYFAMMELKILLCAVISKFRFEPSPGYVHSPCMRLLVEPELGIELIASTWSSGQTR